MNWLMYIGGWWLFTIVFMDKVMGLKCESQNKEMKKLIVFIIFTSLIAILMVWIWICWRFI